MNILNKIDKFHVFLLLKTLIQTLSTYFILQLAIANRDSLSQQSTEIFDNGGRDSRVLFVSELNIRLVACFVELSL
jgi:hypothetical protein